MTDKATAYAQHLIDTDGEGLEGAERLLFEEWRKSRNELAAELQRAQQVQQQLQQLQQMLAQTATNVERLRGRVTASFDVLMATTDFEAPPLEVVEEKRSA